MNSWIDENFTVVFRDQILDYLVIIAPEAYKDYVNQHQNGRKSLYVTLDKAMFGALRAALIFWKNLVALLIKLGFELNLYDPCVANKLVNG